MGKRSTEPGLGPERRATAADPGAAAQATPPRRKADTIDILLDGFRGRPERPRVAAVANDATPTPPEARMSPGRHLSKPEPRAQIVTEPGRRQRHRGLALGVIGGALLVLLTSLFALQIGGFWLPPAAPSVAPLTSAKLTPTAAWTQPIPEVPAVSSAPTVEQIAPPATTEASAPKLADPPHVTPRVRVPTVTPTSRHPGNAQPTTGADPADLRGHI